SFAISTVLGLATITMLGGLAWGLALSVSPLFGWPNRRFLGIVPLEGAAAPVVGILAVIVGAAAVIGLALLQGVIARAIF
ncbi:hypothetical protein NPN18_26630, partial [Vibrio parahaemolyticus]|nr:hypothetical protein [Vibrio parahaemolyticus]